MELERVALAGEPEQVAAPAAAPAGPVSRVLQLQATAGNAAVARALAARRTLARQPQATARTAQQIADLDEDITQAIAEKETHRRAVESSMRTSAGVRASYASEVQATAPWTITALQQLDDARLATFGITRDELRDANARAAAAGDVWTAVMATPAATNAQTWAAANSVLMARAGLVQADIDRMFLFRDLRNDLETRLTTDVPRRTTELQGMAPADVWALATAAERAAVGAARADRMNEARRNRLAPVIARRETIAAVAASQPATTLGINAGTIAAYRPVRGGSNYGEDRAAWQRVAVGREPPGGTGTVGARIETAATADGGLRLGRARIAHIDEQFLAAHPDATDDQVVANAARHHNPGNPMVDAVTRYFHQFHDARGAAPAGAGGAGAAPPQPQPAAPGRQGALDAGPADTQLADAGAGPPSTAAAASPAPDASAPAAATQVAAADLQRPPAMSEADVIADAGLSDPEAEPVAAA